MGRPTGLRRNDSYTAEVHVPRPAAALLAKATVGKDDRWAGDRVLTVPFKPGESATQVRGAFSRSSVVLDAEMHFNAWGSDDSGYAAYPTLSRAVDDIDHEMKRTKYARTWALVKEMREGAENPMDYIRRVDTFLRSSAFQYTERPPATPVDETPLDYFINVSHLGYCQHFAGAMAVMLRNGAHPRPRGRRLHPGRLLGAPQGLDRPRHRRPRVGRGLVRQVRLGRHRPDAGRHPRPLPGCRAGRRRLERPGHPGPRHGPGG